MAELVYRIEDLYARVRWNAPFPHGAIGTLLRYRALVRGGVEQLGGGVGLEDELGAAVWADLRLGDVEFALPPVLSVQGQLMVVSTAVAGANGSVKEVAGVEDYRITLRAMLTEVREVAVEPRGGGFVVRVREDVFPERVIRRVRTLFEGRVAVRVVSPYLALFGIDQVLITGLSFPEAEGLQGFVPCEMQLLSDKPFVLEEVV